MKNFLNGLIVKKRNSETIANNNEKEIQKIAKLPDLFYTETENKEMNLALAVKMLEMK